MTAGRLMASLTFTSLSGQAWASNSAASRPTRLGRRLRISRVIARFGRLITTSPQGFDQTVLKVVQPSCLQLQPAGAGITLGEGLVRRHVLAQTEREDLPGPGPATIHRDPFESQAPALQIGRGDVLSARLLGEVDGLGDRVVYMTLEGLLDPEVLTHGYLGGGGEEPPDGLRNAPRLSHAPGRQDHIDQPWEVARVLLRIPEEERVDLHQRLAPQRVLTAVGEGEERLDAPARAGDDADRACRSHGEPRGVPHPLSGLGVHAAAPVREDTTLLGELARRVARLGGDERHQAVCPGD